MFGAGAIDEIYWKGRFEMRMPLRALAEEASFPVSELEEAAREN